MDKREYQIPEGYEAKIEGNKVIFEPKESEDERIRKELLTYLEHEYLVDKTIKCSEYNKYVAWLEKQGEKIDAIENFDTEFEKQVSCLIASDINKEYKYNQGCVKWAANALLNYAKHELEKQGSQNLANSTKTCKDEPKFKVGDTIHKIGENTIFPMVIEKIKDGDYVCDNGSTFINIEFQDKYELVVQNPTWSEEDEIGFHDAMWAIEQARTIAKDENDMGNLWYAEKFLKSLKERYTWKPSEEHTSTDAFIEKACDKLAQLMHDQHLFEGRLHQDSIIENFVGDFRNYMKGE